MFKYCQFCYLVIALHFWRGLFSVWAHAVYFYLKGDCDKSYGSDFVFSDHAKELIVGEIFVRVYNEVPTFQLEVS